MPLLFSDFQALERLSFGRSRIRDTLIAQSRILLFWYYSTYLLLEKNKPKYQQLEPPTLDEKRNLQIEPLDNDNMDKTQPEGDLQIETFDNDTMDKAQPKGDLQIESFDNDDADKPQTEEPPSLDQVESKDGDSETPQIDQIRPFILEGL